MKQKIKTTIAFSLSAIAVIVSVILSALDRPDDVYPSDDTKIYLYGEAHGYKPYYDIEFRKWKECYDDGWRNLFVELPYYSAELLNLWMKENDDLIIDQFFEDIKGTLSGNQYYYDFFHQIKETCPETIFYGTDVGHQYSITGQRYLDYLKAQGFTDSEQFDKAVECIRQGEEFYSIRKDRSGISPVREKYMVENFIKTYDSVGGKIMGIYGSYHTSLNNPDLMAGRLKAHYGDIFSSVKCSSIAFGKVEPYKFGFSLTGLIFLLMLFMPNIIWGVKGKPKDYEKYASRENKILLIFERIGEVAVSCLLLIFPSINPHVKILAEGLYFEWNIIIWITAFSMMILYEGYWIKYFKSERTMEDFYSSFAGFPVAGASLPVIAVFLLGIYSMNLYVIIAAVILGIGHIGIHLMHKKEIIKLTKLSKK
ncbi:MAG: hypothetical protein J5710_02440 [Treponema sp.]|nr:hypothetical protein [Treponema sp.]MBR5645137.1 hypothetical protein [Treponema sp.]